MLILQIVAVLFVIYSILILSLTNIMYVTGVIAAVITFYAFQTLMELIPRNLFRLYDSNIISLKKNEPETASNNSSKGRLESKWNDFIRDLENAMNHYLQCISGFLFTGFSVRDLLLQFSGEGQITFQTINEMFTYPSSIWRLRTIIEPIVGFVIGLIAWRILIVGYFIWQLGKKFDFKLQTGHPDKCGGLEPMGIICLWNALITTIPTIFLGFWVIVSPSIPRYAFWKDVYLEYLSVHVIFAIMSFMLPIYSVHNVMVKKRMIYWMIWIG